MKNKSELQGIIFANGDLCRGDSDPFINPDDLILAADGGSRHCQTLGILPDILIGDLDSTPSGLVSSWASAGVEIIKHPRDKDQTDLELALLLAQERGASRLVVYGAAGGRLDMTFGNLTLLAHPQLTIPTTLSCGREQVHLVHPGEKLILSGQSGDLVSLIPLQPGFAVVSASGLLYSLEHEPLEFGTGRGLSNQLTGQEGSLELESGLLAVVHTRGSSLNKE